MKYPKSDTELWKRKNQMSFKDKKVKNGKMKYMFANGKINMRNYQNRGIDVWIKKVKLIKICVPKHHLWGGIAGIAMVRRRQKIYLKEMPIIWQKI